MNMIVGCWNLKVIFCSSSKFNILFRLKDTLQKKVYSFLVYRYTCSSYSVTYYGKAYCHFFNRAVEHISVSNLTEKGVKIVKLSAVSGRLLEYGCSTDIGNLVILAVCASKFKLLIKESRLTKPDKKVLNRTVQSFLL